MQEREERKNESSTLRKVSGTLGVDSTITKGFSLPIPCVQAVILNLPHPYISTTEILSLHNQNKTGGLMASTIGRHFQSTNIVSSFPFLGGGVKLPSLT